MAYNYHRGRSRKEFWSNLRPHVFYRLDGTEAAAITRDELRRCVGDLVSLDAHVAEGRLLAGESLLVNAVALWAIQEAWHAAFEHSEALAAERDDVVRGAYQDALMHDTKNAARGIFGCLRINEVHEGCFYPSWDERPEWVTEWDLDTQRWWRHPRLAAEFVAYAQRMKAEFDAFIDGAGCRRSGASSPSGSRKHGPVELKVRALLHLYLVDVAELIESRLPTPRAPGAAAV